VTRPSPRPRPWLPLLGLLLQLALVGVGSWLIDASDLDQAIGSWGFVFAFGMATVFYASWPVLVTLVCAVAGAVASSTAAARRAAVLGAGVSVVWTGFVIVLGAHTAVTARYEAEVVFGLLLVGASVVALLPLRGVVAGRRRTA
jgi:hypothetical protein